MKHGINLQCLYRLQRKRHSCIRRLKKKKGFQLSEKKQKVHVMLQFRPLYMLWLKLQNTHRRAPCKKVILWDILAKQGGVRARGEKEEKKKSTSAALCCDMLDTLQKRLSCVSQVMQGRGGPCCWNRAQSTAPQWKVT